MAAMMLAGQDAAWHEWQAALASARMHHGWIFAGQQGIGKAHFARAAAAALVAEEGIPQPPLEAHPDILILDPLPSNDDEAAKRAEGKPWQAKRNITIDQVRQMQQRLITRPTLGRRRAIIIDPADDLEKNAVNALLKSLEEPPVGTYFLLVAHRPGRLLPTIRSRCRILRFAPVADAEIDRVLIRQSPRADAAARAAAIAAAHGSPGVALEFIDEDLAPVHALMLRIAESGDRSMALRGALAEEVGPRPSRARQAAVLELARAVLAGAVRTAGRDHAMRIIAAHADLARLAAEVPTFNYDAGLLAMEIGALLARACPPTEAA